MNRLVQLLVRFFLRWVPDSFVVAGVLSLLTFVLAVTAAGYGVVDTLDAWGDSFWNLLEFTNQITLTLLFGYALANTPPVRRGLLRLAGLVRSPTMAYAGACLVTGVAAMLSWGLSLIVAGITSRAIGEACRRNGVQVHYPLLVASAFSGFVIWHQGLSSSIGLVLATPGHFLEDRIGLVPASETIFNIWNFGLAFFVLVTLPILMSRLAPKDPGDIEPIPEALMPSGDGTAKTSGATALTPAMRLERSPILMLLMVACGGFYIYTHFIVRGNGLTLDIFNFLFLVVGILLAGSLVRYVQIIVEGGQVAAPFLLQYPFYSGIAGVMGASGLAQMVVNFFVRISTPETLPFFAFFSGGLLNLFIPSGGGQWAVQGPIILEAAFAVGADIPRTAMGVALGDQWTNLIQPLAIVPVLAIAQIPLSKIMGYCFVAVIYTGTVFSLALLLF